MLRARVEVRSASRPSHPSVSPPFSTGVPIAHRREVRQARMIVAAPMHDREPAVFVEPLETHHRRVKAKSVGNPDRLAL